MFGRAIPLFRVFGFQIKLDPSWFVLALLVTWSLAQGLFPVLIEGLPSRTYWLMGAIGALGLFASIVFHELSHALVARRYGLPMKGITLFIFGGVAEMESEPERPKAEFWMAIAGPIASVMLGMIGYALDVYGSLAGWNMPALAVVRYLGQINLVLAAFNMIPAFPLDGGRILRSALWSWKKNLRWATNVSARIGGLFGAGLIGLGVVSVLLGNFVGGMWWFLIGLFLRNASQASYQQVVLRQTLHGEPVRRFMRADVVALPPWISLQEAVNEYFYRHQYRTFPVVSGERLLGCLSTEQVKHVPRDEWDRHTVQEMLEPCAPENTIEAGADTMDALARMTRSGKSRLMVIENGRLAGVLSLRDLTKFLALKLDLEGEEPPAELPRAA